MASENRAQPEPGWFNPIADFLGPAYWAPNTTRVQAFAAGTNQEVRFLIEAMQLQPGARILDLGCGPGRHSLALAALGYRCLGIDLAETFIALASTSARELGLADQCEFRVGNVDGIDFRDEFDAVICLCQGGFGLLVGAEDTALLQRFASALRPGARIAISAFHSYFATRYLEAGDDFDPATGVNHERASLRNSVGAVAEHDLWTTCFTSKELTLLASTAGLNVESISGVTPGDYALRPVALDRPELLLIAQRLR